MVQIITPSGGQQFQSGTEVKFSCSTGKFIDKGPHSIKCSDNGEWSDSERPYCKGTHIHIHKNIYWENFVEINKRQKISRIS